MLSVWSPPVGVLQDIVKVYRTAIQSLSTAPVCSALMGKAGKTLHGVTKRARAITLGHNLIAFADF